MPVPTHASAEVVKQESGYIKQVDWRYFLQVTKTTLESSGKGWTNFKTVPPKDKREYFEDVNKGLERGGLKPASEEVLDWRLEKLMRPPSQRNVRDRTANSSSVTTPPASRPFDPVRDLE
ncbi:hypothetical protein BU24DRAFT_59554 [Aaosphaeria arxii CBS 175.79]|uniref:Uncharacterized protein n=1 Tax=Aaosphaeria arxii CBS 175.79 TaxID=1450172 RepID=A0A6A5XC98_9PLEO|nr:uncharacterized protein BU24DRAFT_59554 [Aaosphaeria arxii CBS 175.79]KAF2010523.1 hypothetical protein BU24DRAFT_59554 [Aaosphaeria arxii CBS 175.79]